MADVSGLVIGAIALASLFTTCIELFDCFELGRNYAYDYQLACTKMCLLKARISGWGVSLNLEAPGHEHPALRQHWKEEKDVVGRSLFGIKEIFENASLLADKYKLTPRRSRTFRTIVSRRSEGLEPDSRQPNTLKVTVTGWLFLRKRTVWAIHDKQKFDNFIQNLSFLIENLEKVTERIEMPSTMQEPAGIKPAHIPASGQGSLPPAQIETSSQKDTKTSGQQLVLPGVTPSKCTHINKPLDLQQLARQTSGHFFMGNQKIMQGAGVMGNVGKTDKKHVFTGSQTVMLDGFGVLGDVSAKAAVGLREPKNNHDQELDPDNESDETEDERNSKYSQDGTTEDASDPTDMSE